MIGPHGHHRWYLPADFRRSLACSGRSDATVKVYRKSFDSFWTWATDAETGERIPKCIEPATRRIRYANLRPFFT